MVSIEWLNKWQGSTQFILERNFSDHCPIMLRSSIVDWGPKPCWVLDCWFQDRSFRKVVRESWSINSIRLNHFLIMFGIYPEQCFKLEKVEARLNGKNISNCTSKEEVFRNILTLHSLLKYPPGDYPDNVREDIVKGFVRICSFVREEGKISRKLVECINTYLLNDGPNLGFQLFEIHNAMQQFVFCSWLTTHDRVLKDSFAFYARIQLNLMRVATNRCLLVEQLLDMICKDLDQGSMSSTSMLRGYGNKDDKLGALSSSQCGLVELAAVLFYRAYLNTTRSSLSEKRVRREPAAVILRETLVKGKWEW
ncbi:Serine/threonine-protein kinase ATM [Glycine max]|nr:Serine/threonine-protein kinase ATM [Glycine max]